MKPVCLNCGGQGWTQSPHVYDCAQCDMAETRTALESALRADEAKNGLMDWQDQLLFAYNFKMEKTMNDENTKPSADRNAVLEESAAVCEALESDLFDQYKGRGKHDLYNPGRANPEVNGQSDGAGQCAAAIRALKSVAPVAQPLAPSGVMNRNAVNAVLGVLEKYDFFKTFTLNGHCQFAADIEVALKCAAQPLAGQDGRAVTDQDTDIRGPLTDAQRCHARALMSNLLPFPNREGHEDIIRHIAATAYVNGFRDAAPSPVNPKQEQ